MSLQSWSVRLVAQTVKMAGRRVAHIGEDLRALFTSVGFAFLQHGAKNDKPVFRDQEAPLLGAPGPLVTGPEQRVPDDCEIQTAGFIVTGLGVVPHRLLADEFATDKARGLRHGEIAAGVDHVSAWRAMSGFANGFHRRIKARTGRTFKRDGGASMATLLAAILTDPEKPDGAAAPVETECDPAGTHSLRGEPSGSPLPKDEAEFSDNTGNWRSGPDGFFE